MGPIKIRTSAVWFFAAAVFALYTGARVFAPSADSLRARAGQEVGTAILQGWVEELPAKRAWQDGKEVLETEMKVVSIQGDSGWEPCRGRVVLRVDQTLSDHGAVTRGVCQRDAKGYLVGVEEFFELKKNGAKVTGKNKDGKAGEFSGEDPVSMNCWGFNASIFPMLQEGFERFLKKEGGSEKSEYLIPNAVGGWIGKGKARVKVLPQSF